MLFVYGTLQFPEVLLRLLGRVPPSTPARLLGFRAAALPGRPYPGLVPAPGSEARGLLLAELGPEDLATLDAYEGVAYARAEVTLADGARAMTYLWRATDDVLPTDWAPT